MIMEKGQTLWIEVRERVKKNIGLEIGKDISIEEAEELLKLDGQDLDPYHDPNYTKLYDRLGDDVSDSDGYEDVQISVH